MGDIPVLIIGYLRFDMITKIVARALENTSGPIYISIDAARNPSDYPVNQQIREFLENLSDTHPSQIKTNFMDQNVGCSAHVLHACDWFFSIEEFGLVLEDDCLPDRLAFIYLRDARTVYQKNELCLLISLSQFAPKELVGDKWSLSNYPLVWGWAASGEKWNLIRDLILGEFNYSRFTVLKSIELYYWLSGARRAQRGFVDAWDTPLAFGLNVKKLYVLHPPGNFIQNLGNDEVAVHVDTSDHWTNFPIGEYRQDLAEPVVNPALVRWYRDQFFRIRGRHAITNRLRALLDIFKYSRRATQSLSQKYYSRR